jgi:tRNA A37 threonylcarbamoyladenosine modification protein TsaB
MKTVYLERSTGECRSGAWVESVDLSGKPARLVVGTGPGSFAGIRSALAFAQGYAIGAGCEVLGLPSPCAIAAQVLTGAVPAAPSPVPAAIAVVGDARRGKLWLALFDGFSLLEDVFQIDQADLAATLPQRFAAAKGALPAAFLVTTPDEARIGALLQETFGPAYVGGVLPTAEGLRIFAERNPSVLRPEPLPLYLNPAVREPIGAGARV